MQLSTLLCIKPLNGYNIFRLALGLLTCSKFSQIPNGKNTRSEIHTVYWDAINTLLTCVFCLARKYKDFDIQVHELSSNLCLAISV